MASARASSAGVGMVMAICFGTVLYTSLLLSSSFMLGSSLNLRFLLPGIAVSGPAVYCGVCRTHMLSQAARQSVFVCVQFSPVFLYVEYAWLKHECCAPCHLSFTIDLSVHVPLPAMSFLP